MPSIKELVFINAKAARRILRAFDHDLRRNMLNRILDMGNKVDVTTLYAHLGLEQSVCSQQLSILRGAKLVKVEKSGKYRYYSVDQDRVAFIDKLCQQMISNEIIEPA